MGCLHFLTIFLFFWPQSFGTKIVTHDNPVLNLTTVKFQLNAFKYFKYFILSILLNRKLKSMFRVKIKKQRCVVPLWAMLMSGSLKQQ